MITYSICIPFYGAENFLCDALDSALSLHGPYSKEIMVLLDAEVSQRVRKSYECRGVNFFPGASRGLAANWNECIRRASGEYIIILHSDDVLNLNYLDIISRLQSERPKASIWFTSADVIDESGDKVRTIIDVAKHLISPRGDSFELQGDSGMARLLFGCFLYCSSACYRRSLLAGISFDESLDMAVDLDLYGRVLIAGGSIAGTSAKGLFYRRHRSSVSEKLRANGKRFEEEERVIKALGSGAYDTHRWVRSRFSSFLRFTLRAHRLLSTLVMRG